MVMIAVVSMTLALVLYVLAYVLAKNYRFWHIVAALVAFGLDLYATYLMETKQLVVVTTGKSFLYFHIAISMTALLTFIALAVFGSLRKRKPHVFIAKYIFFPIWLTSYLSGMYLIISS